MQLRWRSRARIMIVVGVHVPFVGAGIVASINTFRSLSGIIGPAVLWNLLPPPPPSPPPPPPTTTTTHTLFHTFSSVPFLSSLVCRVNTGADYDDDGDDED